MHKTLILLLFCLNSAVAQTTVPVQELIREHCEAIQEGFDGSVAGDRVAAGELLATFYSRRGFRPAWQAAGRLEALLQVLQDARAHGLDPEDYHYATLLRLASAANGPGTTAERDILATDALIRYGYHLHFGKVDPDDPPTSATPVTVLNAGAETLFLLPDGFTLIGPDAGQFSLVVVEPPAGSGTRGALEPLEPGQSRAVQVQFTPVDEGRFEATLRIESDDRVAPVIDIPLSGWSARYTSAGPGWRPECCTT